MKIKLEELDYEKIYDALKDNADLKADCPFDLSLKDAIDAAIAFTADNAKGIEDMDDFIFMVEVNTSVYFDVWRDNQDIRPRTHVLGARVTHAGSYIVNCAHVTHTPNTPPQKSI